MSEASQAARTYVPLQIWRCDKCRHTSELEIPHGTTAWEAYQMILQAHRTGSLECHTKYGAECVRLVYF